MMKAVVLGCLLAVLAGCASRGTAVRCDGRLEPINTPAPAAPSVSNASPAETSREPEPDRE